MATRWGICGTGNIANDFCLCLKSLPNSEHQIAAVASRIKERADTFASKFQIQKSYGSYEELAKDPNVDVIYVATIDPMHVDVSLLFINAGKNVLCEKPMALALEGCQKVLRAAKEKGVLFMEAYWTCCFPAFKFIHNHIKSGAIGDVIMVQATMAMNIPAIDKINDPKLGGGAVLDFGCYTVLAANFVFKERPERIVADGTKKGGGDDKTGVILLKYPGNKFASLSYSAVAKDGSSSLVIRGTKGNITIPDLFMGPDKVILENDEVRHFPLPDIENVGQLNYPNSQGLTYEAQCFRECLQIGSKECENVSHKDSETVMYIMQEVLKQYASKA